MKRFRSRAVLVLTVIGLCALSGVALAATEGENDTVFNYGYDEESQFFMWNVTSLDYEPDADALAEALEEHESLNDAEFEALLEACGLEAAEGEEPIEYGYTFDGETVTLYALTDDAFDPEADEPVDTGDCGEPTGGVVTGPEGQVNHGMFLKLFNSVYDGPNRGCLVRHIAQSDLGMGDQQVEEDPEFDPEAGEESIEDGRVSFTTVGTDCQHGPTGDDSDELETDEGDDEEDRGGPPQFVLDKRGDDGPGNGNGDGNGNGQGKPEGVPGGGRP